MSARTRRIAPSLYDDAPVGFHRTAGCVARIGARSPFAAGFRGVDLTTLGIETTAGRPADAVMGIAEFRILGRERMHICSCRTTSTGDGLAKSYTVAAPKDGEQASQALDEAPPL